jgi:Protein of unknown function (DUF3300)
MKTLMTDGDSVLKKNQRIAEVISARVEMRKQVTNGILKCGEITMPWTSNVGTDGSEGSLMGDSTSDSAVGRRIDSDATLPRLAKKRLYPDALIALILPASTVPSDLVLAERYIASNGDPAQVANQPWDDSVKSLTRYPDVLKWMDQNLEWTTQVGEAFLDQPADVMNTIQHLRAQAIAAGNLVDTPQQRIVKEETCIRIVPAEPDVIYVPRYDPQVVYAQPYLGPALTFGVGFAVGSWLNYDCDWPTAQGVRGRLESGMET